MNNQIEFTPYLASAYAEGFCEGENATMEEQMMAWSYLISNGLCWSLQGWYGRTAQHLINSGYIDRDGNVNWDAIYDAM